MLPESDLFQPAFVRYAMQTAGRTSIDTAVSSTNGLHEVLSMSRIQEPQPEEDSSDDESMCESRPAGPPRAARLRRRLVPTAEDGMPLVRYDRLPPAKAAADHGSAALPVPPACSIASETTKMSRRPSVGFSPISYPMSGTALDFVRSRGHQSPSSPGANSIRSSPRCTPPGRSPGHLAGCSPNSSGRASGPAAATIGWDIASRCPL
jgi:hypothetical protein